jgi:predicted PurR-regulated permease PerM
MESRQNKWVEFFKKSVKGITSYVLGKFIISLIIGVCVFAVLYLLDCPVSWLFGLLAGLGNLVPTVGPWFAFGISAVILVFIEPVQILYLLIAALAMQVVDNFLLTPFITGKSADIKPIIVVILITAGGALFGIPGILLAIPAAIVVKVFYRVFVQPKKDEPKKEE